MEEITVISCDYDLQNHSLNLAVEGSRSFRISPASLPRFLSMTGCSRTSELVGLRLLAEIIDGSIADIGCGGSWLSDCMALEMDPRNEP